MGNYIGTVLNKQNTHTKKKKPRNSSLSRPRSVARNGECLLVYMMGFYPQHLTGQVRLHIPVI